MSENVTSVSAVTPGRPLRLGTRASELATAQSGWVADRLRALGHEVELVLVQTEGDVNSAPLTQIGGTGDFVSALREALLAGEIDCAVHSLKDLPVGEAPGLVVAAIPEREDPRDVLISRDGRSLSQLPEGAVIGTGSPRRAVQLSAVAPAATIRGIRGNVGRRISLVTNGELDAVVLAAAGLRRLGRLEDASQVLETQVMLPAPGQGALAVECRMQDQVVAEHLAALEHAPTRVCVTAERALLGALEAGCSAPIGALATLEGETIVLAAVVGTSSEGTPLVGSHSPEPDLRAGTDVVTQAHGILRHTLRGSDALLLGQEMAAHFLRQPAVATVSHPPQAPSAQHPGA